MSENFHQELHEFCKSFEERWCESLEGFDKVVEFRGPIEANYPWHYINFTYRGTMLWGTMDAMVKDVQDFCARNRGASFQSASFSALERNRTNLKFTLIYNLQPFL